MSHHYTFVLYYIHILHFHSPMRGSCVCVVVNAILFSQNVVDLLGFVAWQVLGTMDCLIP